MLKASRKRPRLEADYKFIGTIRVRFLSAKHAKLFVDAVSVDDEPRADVLTSVWADENVVHIRWSADEVRLIRTMCSVFFDHAIVIMRTVEAFGEDKVSS
ncbi:hypothetical protein ACOME3_004837 [Neoechinorhynchus agilis]